MGYGLGWYNNLGKGVDHDDEEVYFQFATGKSGREDDEKFWKVFEIFFFGGK